MARRALAAVGAILFGLSDTLIAIERFRTPLPGAPFAIIVLYWAGQAGIAASAPCARRPIRPGTDPQASAGGR
jgi:uncharacterized membrane protein YhhN